MVNFHPQFIVDENQKSVIVPFEDAVKEIDDVIK